MSPLLSLLQFNTGLSDIVRKKQSVNSEKTISSHMEVLIDLPNGI